MCHLDGMKASRSPLPFPSPWDKAWTSVTKIIDSLHINNHKDESCIEKYDPSVLKKKIPEGNTMAAEQMFVWLSRFKKILCAMPKVHHLFYVHCMVNHRNRYTVTCYKHGKKPLLPKARNKKCKESVSTGNIKVLFYYVYSILSVEFVNSMLSVFSLQPGIRHLYFVIISNT